MECTDLGGAHGFHIEILFDLLPLATLVTCVELCLALHVCFMSCMDSVCDLWLEFELGL